MCLFDHVLYCKDIAVIRILSSGLNHAGNLASSPVVFRFCTVSIFFCDYVLSLVYVFATVTKINLQSG